MDFSGSPRHDTTTCYGPLGPGILRVGFWLLLPVSPRLLSQAEMALAGAERGNGEHQMCWKAGQGL